MKDTIYYILIFLAIGLFYAFNNPVVDFKKNEAAGIHFTEMTFQEALAEAKKENKLIFIDIYATWCGPCKKLKKYTFSDEKVGTFYNDNFINISFDGEQNEGLNVMNKYHLSSYPSLLFVDASGKVVHQSGGYKRTNDFLEMGIIVLNKKQ